MLSDNNCAPKSILQYLSEQVSALSCADESVPALKLFVLSDEYEHDKESNSDLTFMDYSPRRFQNEFLARKRLILVYQGAQIVLGMSVFEYAYDKSSSSASYDYKWSRAYIQYVDTTGLFVPRQNQSHLTKSLVRAYLSYCKTVLNMGSVHLLATAKPAFLFAGSEFNEGKRAFPAVKLINWWIGLLQDFTAKDPKTKVFVYSPAEEVEGSSRMKKRITSIGSNWIYGLPYASSLPCVKQIPLFEDDPKWKHFEATVLEDDELIEQLDRKKTKRPRIIDEEGDETNTTDQSDNIKCRMSVKEFFESIQIRPEFRSDPSTFFVLQFPKKIQDLPEADEKAVRLIKSDLASFGMKMLASLTFESESAAKNSSMKISGWLKLMSVASCEIKIIEKENLAGDLKESKSSESTPVVNSIQSLIKKKTLVTK